MPTPSKRPFPAPPSNNEPSYTPLNNLPSSPKDRSFPNTPEFENNGTSTNARDSYPNPYSNLGGAYISPEMADSSQLLGRRGSEYMPAPSILSRDSTHESLIAPGTPNLPGSRSSWGSNTGLAGAAEGIAGSDLNRPRQTRGQSALHHSTLGWNNNSDDRLSTSEEDDEGQGHIAPAVAAGAAAGATADMSEKRPKWAADTYAAEARRHNRKKWIWGGAAVAAIIIIGAGIGLGIGLTRNKSSNGSNSNLSSSNNASHTGTGTATTSANSASATSGGQGSLITLANGETMTYDNAFGGIWVWNESDPFNNDAQAQSYTPKLSESWNWGVDKIYGVNIGGWLNTEPFIVPALYETYASGVSTAIDEYTLSQNIGENLTAVMTEHYETFITERDFAEIASAGLNWVRIPIAHWAIETWPDEPHLPRVSWTYFLKAIQWARKYGLRINLDLHTIPGSQNGWNHSGRQGTINWMDGPMGLANAQRGLDYIRVLAEFISQPEYSPVIQMFGFLNEPNAGGVGQNAVGSFYFEAYKIIREITGIGEGKGPFLTIHDAFVGMPAWYNFMPGMDRVGLDQHSYYMFGDQPTGTLESISHRPCGWWASATNQTSKSFGVNIAGEFSSATNDCSHFLNNVGAGNRYDGTYAGYTGPVIGSCDYWNDWTLWNQSTINDIQHFTLGSMDALQNWFFWTWKIGNSTGDIKQVNPFWHYRLGLQNGWIPKDPRSATGICAQEGVNSNQFSGTFAKPYMTGGVGAGTIAANYTAAYPFPPVSFSHVPSASMSRIPQYTQTGTQITMPGPTFTKSGSTSTISAGSGWYDASDNKQAYAQISGCSYMPEYSAFSMAVPTNACGAGLRSDPLKKRREEAVLPRATARPGQ